MVFLNQLEFLHVVCAYNGLLRLKDRFPIFYLPFAFWMILTSSRSTQLNSIRKELLSVSIDNEQKSSRRMLFLLEEARIERKKTWLIDIVTIVEILIVALMHVLLVEILTLFFHL